MLSVYYLRVSDFIDCPDSLFLSYVGDATRQEVCNYRNQQMVRTKLLGESLIRRLLFVNYGLPPDHYNLVKGEHGKPYLEGNPSPLFFNLSHSGDYIVCAIDDREVGIDIEHKGKMRMAVARRFFHPAEILKLDACEKDQQADLFFRYWSVKESFLKYTGEGLAASLSGFQVCFEEHKIQIIRKNDQLENVYIHECQIDQEYKCFVCSEKAEIPEIYSVYDMRSVVFDLRS